MKMGAWRFAASGVLSAALCAASLGSAKAEGTILQFQGGNQAGSGGFIPSDMGGAVGSGYVMQTVNGIVSVFNANTGQLDSQTSLASFWQPLGLSLNFNAGNYPSDPRVIFDPSSNRWFTSVINTAAVNQVGLAVSNTANPLQGFKAVTFNASSGQFYDYPTLGVNHGAVTIGTNNFSATSGNFDSSGLFSIPKADLLGANPTLAHMTSFNNLNALNFTNEPVTNLSGTGTGTTVINSINSPNVAAFGGEQILKLSNVSSSNATLTTGPSLNNPLDYNNVINPVQPGGTAYQANDPRISSGPVQVGNLIYFTNSVLTGNHDSVYWGVLNATNDSLMKSGVVNGNGLDLTFPSIAANGSGTFVIGFNGSGPGTNISAYNVVCSESTGACGAPNELYAGQGNNYVGYTINGQPDVRWGDYSWTTADPYNANNFWMFQDYVTSNNLWGTVVTEFSVPEPGSLLVLGTGLIGLALVRRNGLRRRWSRKL